MITASRLIPRGIVTAAPDGILGLNAAFNRDQRPEKVNLGVGAYRDGAGNPWVLPSVASAMRRISCHTLDGGNVEYAPISGVPDFLKAAAELLYGTGCPAVAEGRVLTLQGLSGTGSLRIGLDILRKLRCGGDNDGNNRRVYVPCPTWANHVALVKAAGLMPFTYPYIARAGQPRLDLCSMRAAIEAAPSGSVVLLHACAHNPSGMDPGMDFWRELSRLMLRKRHVAFFDVAYQGFASGDPDADAAPVRLFAEQGHTMVAAQSFAKNFGLYGERTGALSFVLDSKEEAEALRSQAELVIRAAYSSPPIHGARIVAEVLGNAELKAQWRKDLVAMVQRLQNMREKLCAFLEEEEAVTAGGSRRDWSYIKAQRGMFALLDLTPVQVERLATEFSVYMTRDGRLSVAGLQDKNVRWVAKSIALTTRS
jgi:aspartate aminotransferase